MQRKIISSQVNFQLRLKPRLLHFSAQSLCAPILRENLFDNENTLSYMLDSLRFFYHKYKWKLDITFVRILLGTLYIMFRIKY